MTDPEQVLASVDIFADFPHEFVVRCAKVAGVRSYASGEIAIRQDDPATAFYVVTRGCLEVLRADAGGTETVVATLDPGRFFGEMALLRDGTRVATVRACEDAECLVLEKADFDAELRKDPNSAAVMATRLARRINMLSRGA